MDRQPGQPKGARGTVGHAYSALNLRLLLALFGLVMCAAGAALLFAIGRGGYAWLLVALALVALVDAIVVQRRRTARRRHHPSRRSLFE
ncbi:MAG: DUF6343 family protein [Micromonosporaceae bacterium]